MSTSNSVHVLPSRISLDFGKTIEFNDDFVVQARCQKAGALLLTSNKIVDHINPSKNVFDTIYPKT